MLNRLFPIFIVFCIFGLALFTYLSWRTTERSPQAEDADTTSQQVNRRLTGLTPQQQIKLIEEYALRAEAAAARAQVALEKIEALAAAGALPAVANEPTGESPPSVQPASLARP